jgi:hypothetical protein
MVDHLSPYLFRKRGIYYFSRRVPKDLLDHYERSKIVFSLRTKSCRAAKIKAASLASQLEEDWLTLRWRSKDTPLLRFLKGQAAEARISSSAPLMTETAADGSRQVQNRLEFSEIILTWVNYKIYY